MSEKRERFLLSLNVAKLDFTGRVSYTYGSLGQSTEVHSRYIVWCVRGVLTGTVMVTCHLIRNADQQAHPRPTELET